MGCRAYQELGLRIYCKRSDPEALRALETAAERWQRQNLPTATAATPAFRPTPATKRRRVEDGEPAIPFTL